ncbi:MAG TPA: toxin-antitoxin system, antitoxin component, Xre family protein [Alphaproteobacteria bacterium]|nr:toxin-antitoxin system, antitoxin component, Xre family protein [Alphaproteobacteria bacterium]
MNVPVSLIEKIKALSAERLAEVEDFIDFIVSRDKEGALVRAAGQASADSFAAVWSNPEDDVYDAL